MTRPELLDTQSRLRAQFGDAPFTVNQAAAAGVPHRRIATAARQGLLQRLRRGTYAVADSAVESHGSARAHIRRLADLGIPAVLGEQSAGDVWRIACFGRSGPLAPAPLTLLIPYGSTSHRGTRYGVRLREAELHERDVTEWDGVPITTPLRTALDVARALGRDRPSALIPLCSGLRAEGARRRFPLWVPASATRPPGAPSEHEITSALRDPGLRAALIGDLVEAISRMPPYGMKWTLQVLDDVEPLLETAAEGLAWSVMTASTLPRPEPQARVRGDSGRWWRADFRIGRVLLEVDGAIKYADTTPWEEKQRQSDLEAAGYWVVRCTWAELLHQPERVIARILLALERSAR